MEEKDDVFRFEEFLSESKIVDLAKMKQNLIDEGIFDSEEYEDDGAEESAFDDVVSEEDGSYKLYRDKSEDFVCDISVEGVRHEDTEVRLIIESDDWTLMFAGEISNGKCIIPIKKLSLFSEGQTGNIKLEVNADGNLFTPWENRFVVRSSKKVTVSMNESSSSRKKGGVRVRVGSR